MPVGSEASSKDITLRFKYHKTTAVLLCDPHDSFPAIKAELLRSLKESGVKQINGIELPEESDDIILGSALDKHDLSKGWVNLETPEFDEGRKASKASRKGSTPSGAGLKDGAVLAFRIKQDKQADDMEVDDEWDVIIPSYDEDRGNSQ